jgi:magnesium and cobalt exporter, CNNM family
MLSPIRSADPRIPRMSDGSTGPGTGDLPDPGTRLDRLLRGLSQTSRWLRRRPQAPSPEAELRDLVARTDSLGREARSLIGEVIGAGDRHVRELMVPRNQVVFLDASTPVAQAATTVSAARHSRFPVVDGSADEVLGFVHLRDLLIRPAPETATTVRELTRPLRSLPASKGVLAALAEMRRAGDHLALIVDEYGGTAGIVTLEDLIEELVGEIHDEYDAAPEIPAEDGPTEVDGLLNLNDFAERTGIMLPSGPYDTVGGFVMAALGRLAVLGDTVDVPAGGQLWHLIVSDVDGRRVGRVTVSGPREAAVAEEPALVQPVIAAASA